MDMIQVKNVGKIYPDTAALVDVSFSVRRGECFGVIGPNGSGKSTLIKLLSAVEQPDSGEIMLDNRLIDKHTRKEMARWLAVLQQEALQPVGFTVREVVEMGRFPFQNWLGEEQTDPTELIDSIIDKLDLEQLQHRPLEFLSGGERQLAALAKTMAQQPRLLMLDEPTTYLDIGHQVHLMDRIRQWRNETDLTVVAVLHDLNLASLYCDRIMLLHKGEALAVGTPRELLHSELLREAYGVSPVVVEHPLNGLPQIMMPG